MTSVKIYGLLAVGCLMSVFTTPCLAFSGDTAVSGVEKSIVFEVGEAGSKYYRIPAVVTAADGSLVVLADKRGDSNRDLPNTISVVSKRSTDGGRTWSGAVTVARGDKESGKTYGDAAVTLDSVTGNLVAVFSGDTGFFHSTPEKKAGFYVSVSTDNGVTWGEPVAITEMIYQPGWHGAFAASGKMLQTKSGRIMFVANTRLTPARDNTDVYEFVCYTDDGGKTWGVLNPDSRLPAEGDGNESKIVETSDGTLLMSIRTYGHRRFSSSADGGVTWGEAVEVADLVEPDCNGDILVYPSTDGISRMLHTVPADGEHRRDVSILMSYDEGKTWPVRKKLVSGSSAYSSLTVLPDGSIGCFVEEGAGDGYRLSFIRVPFSGLENPE